MRYPVVLHKDPNSDYGVTVPDLPGYFSAGETIDEALQEVVEAIECHLEGLLLDGEPLPMETHQHDPAYADGIWAVVAVDLAKLTGKAKRIHVTLPEPIWALVDQYASEYGETRSGLMAEAALEYIASRERMAG